MAINVAQLLEGLPAAQNGYFTRAQAAAAGIKDYDLTRATAKHFIERLGHGVYRVIGAPYDRFTHLRIAWLRLAPTERPRARMLKPTIWVSHESAADLHGCGVFLADTPTFTTVNRIQPVKGVRVHRRSRGLKRNEWTTREGFAVTTVNRTAADLHAARIDGGHLGRFLHDVIHTGQSKPETLQSSMGIALNEFEALIDMSMPPTGPAKPAL